MRPSPRARSWSALLLAVLGVAIVSLSLLPAWLLHVRNVGGHGLTAITVAWSAWEGRSWPFLPVGVGLGGMLAVGAVMQLARPAAIRPSWLLALAALCAAAFIGSAVPLDRQGYASAVHLTPEWALLVAAGLAVVAVVIAALQVGALRWLAVGGAVVIVLATGVFGGRVVALDLAEGNPRHYADGSYVRQATDGQPSETLVIRDGTYAVGERWSGQISGRGLVAVLTGDPACPDDRGAYRVFAAGGEDIRWNLIVDLCADGERATDLTSGTWQRSR